MKSHKEVIPGYYAIPGFPKYAISLFGKVVDRETQKEAYRSFLSGYVHYTIKDYFGLPRLRGRARLMMLSFRDPELIAWHLQVNHINGNKRDDDLDNLEWVTPRRNCEHAGETGLSSKCVPISVMDVDTGVVTKFPSILECARQFGISKDMINYRVKHGEHRVYPERKQYRLGHDDAGWVVYDDPEISIGQCGTSKKVRIRSVLTGDVLEFEQRQKAAKHLGIAPSTLTQWLAKPNQPVFPGYVQMKMAHDLTPWRHINDPYIELSKTTGWIPVKVLNTTTGDVRVFTSCVDCAKECGISPTLLDYRLKTNGTVVFGDKCRYEYYKTESNKHSPSVQ